MSKFVINHNIVGFESIDIKDNRIDSGNEHSIILVLDETTNGKMAEYYNKVRDILISGNKLYLVIVGKESKIRKPISSLMANYRNYNIYKVDNKHIISAEYANEILEREPSIEEIQQYIGGDISGYADMSIILMGIDELASRGDIEGLRRFLEEHLFSIESLTGTIEYMKKIVDSANSQELLARIEDLKSRIKELDKKLDDTEQDNNKYKDENIKLVESNNTAKQELSKLMSKNKELEQQLSSSAPVIQTYSEINTALIKCKTNHVIYFKEVSYVQYTNSLVTMIAKILRMKRKVKLIIYDTKVGLSTIYKPLSVIGGSEFVANKSNFVSSVDTFVVVEPNPTILTSILESTNPTFDIVIVYDRMRQMNNIVTGNNVVKFFVINSYKDFKEVQGQLRITDKSSIITRVGSSIGKETLNIPKIEEYSLPGKTDSAKLSKYKQLQSIGSNKAIIQFILDKARIQ